MMETVLILVNFAACSLIGWICICRLNLLGRQSDWRVRAQFTAYFVGAQANGFGFLFWEDHPTVGSTLLSIAVLAGLMMSRHRWSRGAPPDTRAPRSWSSAS